MRVCEKSIRHVILVKADLTGSALMTADFRLADLRNCKFNQSTPIFADFCQANLQNADMAQTDVGGAVFNYSNLKGAIMLCNRLEEASLEGAIFDKNTIWPENDEPERQGAIRF
ncbi:MAG: hypothetical protein DRR08_12535 [Candidatus Parabeggiatoa sp. nov. 2]|nr:MAG: hypothetical protein DRR08_12535 [Gammaproteobacteria bacterium]